MNLNSLTEFNPQNEAQCTQIVVAAALVFCYNCTIIVLDYIDR